MPYLNRAPQPIGTTYTAVELCYCADSNADEPREVTQRAMACQWRPPAPAPAPIPDDEVWDLDFLLGY